MGYVFDPAVLQATARPLIGLPIEELVSRLIADLGERYPGYINDSPKWVFNNAGGAMGAMTLLHASLTEYVIIFGTAIGTEGHTGRFHVDDYFIILDGEQWAYEPGQLQRHTYRPGDIHVMRRGTARGYRMPDRCWALEYARGAIPLMLPFGLADTLSSTLDWVTLGRTFSLYGRSVLSALQRGKL